MFKIALVDIGGDGIAAEYDTTVETLAEAEIIAMLKVNNYLGTVGAELIHKYDLIYDVMLDGCSVGDVSIRSI